MELCEHIYDEQGCYWVCDLIFWTFNSLTDCRKKNRICLPTMMLVYSRTVMAMMSKLDH